MLKESIKNIELIFSGIDLIRQQEHWCVNIPQKYQSGHVGHFAVVTKNSSGILKDWELPDWDVPNMIAKYFMTIEALKLAKMCR